MLFQKKYLIGQELVRREMLSQDNLDDALMENERTGDHLGRILVRCGFISEDDLLNVLSDQLSLPIFKIEEADISDEVIRSIPDKVARKYKIVPIKEDEETITICISDPLSPKEVEEVMTHLKKKAEIVIDSDRNVLKAVKKYYGIVDKNDLAAIDDDDDLD